MPPVALPPAPAHVQALAHAGLKPRRAVAWAWGARMGQGLPTVAALNFKYPGRLWGQGEEALRGHRAPRPRPRPSGL